MDLTINRKVIWGLEKLPNRHEKRPNRQNTYYYSKVTYIILYLLFAITENKHEKYGGH